MQILDELGSIKKPNYDQGGIYIAAVNDYIATYSENFNSALNSIRRKWQSTSDQDDIDYRRTLDKAVSAAIKNSAQYGKKGEFITAEGHTILDSEQKEDIVKAYLVSSYTNFHFEKDVFTAAEKNGFAAVITCEVNENGYRVINFEQSGAANDYVVFIEQKFPEKIQYKALPKKGYYPENLWKKVFDEKGYNTYFEKQKQNQVKPYINGNPKNEIIKLSNKVADFLDKKDMAGLSDVIHPIKGVRFSRYGRVHVDSDLVFKKEQVKTFLNDTKKYVWGGYAGSGFAIEVPPKEYLEKNVFNKSYESAKFAYNEKLSRCGYFNDFQEDAYPNSIMTEYYFKGTNPDVGGLDWTSLRFIFDLYNDKWYLVGIICNSHTM